MKPKIGDILRYNAYKSDWWAVFLVSEHIDRDSYYVVIIDTNMKDLGGPWSLDQAVLDKCTKLA